MWARPLSPPCRSSVRRRLNGISAHPLRPWSPRRGPSVWRSSRPRPCRIRPFQRSPRAQPGSKQCQPIPSPDRAACGTRCCAASGSGSGAGRAREAGAPAPRCCETCTRPFRDPGQHRRGVALRVAVGTCPAGAGTGRCRAGRRRADWLSRVGGRSAEDPGPVGWDARPLGAGQRAARLAGNNPGPGGGPQRCAPSDLAHAWEAAVAAAEKGEGLVFERADALIRWADALREADAPNDARLRLDQAWALIGGLGAESLCPLASRVARAGHSAHPAPTPGRGCRSGFRGRSRDGNVRSGAGRRWPQQ